MNKLDLLTCGVRIINDEHLMVPKQYRFPRSKKKRILKKWASNSNNIKRTPDQNIYIIDNNYIVGHPAIISEVLKKM